MCANPIGSFYNSSSNNGNFDDRFKITNLKKKY